MTKQELRKKYKELRRNISKDTIEEKSINLANNILNLQIWDKDYFHVFLSIEEHKEVNTDPLLSILSGKDKHIVLSKSDFDSRLMTHYLLTDNTIIKKNKWNIPEPVDGIEINPKKLDVVFIPLLAFDKQGHRVGYGKGFYDIFLGDCNPETIKIGLSFFGPEEKIQNVFNSDEKLDFCVTPEHIYKF